MCKNVMRASFGTSQFSCSLISTLQSRCELFAVSIPSEIVTPYCNSLFLSLLTGPLYYPIAMPWTLDAPKILLSQSKSHLVSTPLHSSQMILSHFRRTEAANRSLTGITLSLLYPKAERGGGGGETQLAKDL